MNPDRHFEKAGAFVAATLAIATLMMSCDSPSKDPQLERGWVTNCAGPAFRRLSPNGTAGPGPDRPVFRITDQLVLAVPKKYGPYANSIDREPRECRQITDLPPAPFLYFVIQGDWSAGYQSEDVPTDGGQKRFRPDLVGVRIEPERPSKFSAEEQQKLDRIAEDASNRIYDGGTRQIGGLTCRVPKMGGRLHCFGSRSKGDPDDLTKFDYMRYAANPFVLIQANYASSRYGRIHVYWQAWTSDVSHALDIDRAIWDSLADWNLASKKEDHAERR